LPPPAETADPAAFLAALTDLTVQAALDANTRQTGIKIFNQETKIFESPSLPRPDLDGGTTRRGQDPTPGHRRHDTST
jgi:hypothetical protein